MKKLHCLVKSFTNVGLIKLENFKKSYNKYGDASLLNSLSVLEKGPIALGFLKHRQNEFCLLTTETNIVQKELLLQHELDH